MPNRIASEIASKIAADGVPAAGNRGAGSTASPARAVLLAIALLAAFVQAPRAAVKAEPVAYKQDTASLQGLLVYETGAKGKRPGIVLFPDWMGMTDLARQYGERVAKMGYVVLVADVYGKGVRPKDAQEAGALAGKYRGDRALMKARAKAALEQLRQSPKVDSSETAAMGFCFGGGVALELARSGADLDGVVSVHGNLDTPNPEAAKDIKAHVLVLHGADDPFVPQEQVRAFEERMRSAGVDWTLIQYGNAVHAFTNPNAGSDNSKGAAYNAKASERAFGAMRDFYREIFGAK